MVIFNSYFDITRGYPFSQFPPVSPVRNRIPNSIHGLRDPNMAMDQYRKKSPCLAGTSINSSYFDVNVQGYYWFWHVLTHFPKMFFSRISASNIVENHVFPKIFPTKTCRTLPVTHLSLVVDPHAPGKVRALPLNGTKGKWWDFTKKHGKFMGFIQCEAPVRYLSWFR